MFYTEDQAKHKWCPEMRKVQWHDEAGNKLSIGLMGNALDSDCIASDCMMWRWETKGSIGMQRGYCGKAGKP